MQSNRKKSSIKTKNLDSNRFYVNHRFDFPRIFVKGGLLSSLTQIENRPRSSRRESSFDEDDNREWPARKVQNNSTRKKLLVQLPST